MNPLRRLRAVAPVVDDGDEPADVQALHKAARGDQSAFGTFYDEMSPLVFGIVLKVVRNQALAEEVTQEVFLELWQQAARYDHTKGAPRSWASTIAHRRAVDRVRSEESARKRDDRDAQQTEVPYDVVSDTVDERFERTRVQEALVKLSEAQREAVMLAYYGGHTYREVADLLTIPEGTAKTRIRDGLGRLRDLLEVQA